MTQRVRVRFLGQLDFGVSRRSFVRTGAIIPVNACVRVCRVFLSCLHAPCDAEPLGVGEGMSTLGGYKL